MKFNKAITEMVGGPSLLKKKLTEYLKWYHGTRKQYDPFDALGDIVDIFQDKLGALVSPNSKEAMLAALEEFKGGTSPSISYYYAAIWEAYKTGKFRAM